VNEPLKPFILCLNEKSRELWDSLCKDSQEPKSNPFELVEDIEEIEQLVKVAPGFLEYYD